jgi:O-antigen/teichoic acid export membrane protein
MKRKVINWFNKSEFSKHALTLITGTIVAQLIPIALQPILRRWFDPADFGLFSVYTTITGMVATIGALKYESTVVLPKRDEEGANLVVLSVLISFVYSILIGTVLWMFSDWIIIQLGLPTAIKQWLVFIPFSIFFFSSYQAMNFWLIRKKAFRKSSINKVTRRLAEGSVQLTMASGFSRFGLIVGSIVGDLANFISGCFQLFRQGFRLSFIHKNILLSLLVRYKDFPLYSAVPALLNTVSLALPVLLVNHFFGQEITGYFDLSRLVLALPLALVATSISQVLFQQLTERIQEKREIKSLMKKTAKTLFVISLVLVIGTILFVFPAFDLLFGSEWQLSAHMTQVLVFSYAIKLIVSPMSSSFNALEKVRVSSIWQFCYFLLIAGVFVIPSLTLDNFLYLILTIDCVAYTIYFLLILRQINSYESIISVKR